MKALTPPFAYYGGKTRLAKQIIELIPADRSTYVEPFAGSLAVLLRKQPHTYEVVNDLDDRLVGFWRTLRDRPDELQHALTNTPYSRAEFEHVLSVIDDPCEPVEFARRVFVILRQSRKRSTNATKGDFRASGGPPAGPGSTFSKSVDSFPGVAERLRSVVIENTDAVKMIRQWDKPDAIMYLDPPYVGEMRTHRNYTVENAGIDFHEELAETIRDAKARIILSGYDHGVYDTLREWRRVSVRGRTGSTSARTRYATETLWVNF